MRILRKPPVLRFSFSYGNDARVTSMDRYRHQSDDDEEDSDEWPVEFEEIAPSRNLVAPTRRFLLMLAKKGLQEIVDTAHIDQSTDEVVLTAHTIGGIMFQERVHSKSELRQFFHDFGFNDYSEGIEPIFGYGANVRIDDLGPSPIDKIVTSKAAERLFTKISSPGTALFTNNGSLLLPDVKVELASVNHELLKFLAANPHKLHTLEPRRFEELIADIFRDFGYN